MIHLGKENIWWVLLNRIEEFRDYTYRQNICKKWLPENTSWHNKLPYWNLMHYSACLKMYLLTLKSAKPPKSEQVFHKI